MNTNPFSVGVKALVAALVFCASQQVVAGWADDWMDQSTQYSGGSYQSDERGYYGVGSISMRNRMTTDYLATVSPPRLEVGCGGIDLFGGAFSYLDSEYLVEKAERIVQAAPAFAFEMAMSELCVKCVDAMNTLTAITDRINSIQVNDCRMSKRLVTAVKENKNIFQEIKAEALGEYSLDQATRKNQQDFAEAVDASGGRSPENEEVLLSNCDDQFRAVFGGGSVMANAADLIGLSAYAPLMRGMMGDAIVGVDGNDVTVQIRNYCAANSAADAEALVEGTVRAQDINGNCAADGSTPVRQIVMDRMMGIMAKVGPGNTAVPTAEEIAFMGRSPFPMRTFLGDVAARGTAGDLNAVVGPLSEQYAQRMMEDMLQTLRYVVETANTVNRNESSVRTGGDPKLCNVAVVAEATNYFLGLGEQMTELRRELAARHSKSLQEDIANRQRTQDMLMQQKRYLNRNVLSQQ